AFNAVGTVVAPVLGSYVFFKDVGDNADAIKNVQWVYLAIACFVFLLAVVFYFSTIPEITDADMMFQVRILPLGFEHREADSRQAQATHVGVAEKPFRKQYRLFHAAFAQFCYTGAQIAIATYFINYATDIRDNTSSATGAIYLAVAQGCFAVGRFSGSFLMHYIKARWVFLAYLSLVIVFNSAATTQRQNTGIAMLSLTLFFESVCFPTILALGIRGIGRHTKRGSGWIVAGVSGGAAVPPILGATADAYSPKGTGKAMVVPVCFMVAAYSYAVAVNFVPAYRDPADKTGAATIGIENANRGSEERDDSGEDVAKTARAEEEVTSQDSPNRLASWCPVPNLSNLESNRKAADDFSCHNLLFAPVLSSKCFIAGPLSSMQQSVVLPPGILSTCHGTRRRPYSLMSGPERNPTDSNSHNRLNGRPISDSGTSYPARPDPFSPVQDPSAASRRFVGSATETIRETLETSDHLEPAKQQIASAVIDFAQPAIESHAKPEQEASNSAPLDIAPPPLILEHAVDEKKPHRSSKTLNRLSFLARSITRSDASRFSLSSDGHSARHSMSSVPEDGTPPSEVVDMPSRIARRLSYVAQGVGGYRASIIDNARAFRHSIFHPRKDSYDIESYHESKRSWNRDSKVIPKSWRFLGIDEHGIGDRVRGVKSNLRDMYDKANVKQKQIKRSKTAQLMFRYTFYLLFVAIIYLLLVGLPLWRGAVWYLYILFQKHMVLKGGLAITLGTSSLYAFAPLLINFEPTAPLPEADESGRAEPSNCDTALIIPCYRSEKLVGATLQAALKIFPKESIFVIANGNSPEPLDNTAKVCAEYGVSHTWSPMGSKIIAQFVGCYVARKFVHVLLIDDDCLLPPNLPIVSDRMRGNIKCIGYIMKATGPDGSLGTLCQQSQDLEYKLCGLTKAFAGKVGSVTFPHGCIVLWDRELLIETFQEHPGFSVSEDWFFGHAARRLGSRITMCTSTFVKTEVPSAVFFSTGGARGGFGEMTVWSQRFYRWNYFFVTGMYYDLSYILFDWKLGWWEIGAKIFVFQEIYETILYLLAPFVIPISFAVRPAFASYIYLATIAMYALNAVVFNY
ncbi:MAG: hypothetical protein Q9169_008046, partial [Polycauliona sp. 2 TL-2023]